MIRANLIKWDSKQELWSHLQSLDRPSLRLVSKSDTPNHYYSAALVSSIGVLEVGILSSMAEPPIVGVFENENRAIVCHDTSISMLDLKFPSVAFSLQRFGAMYDILATDDGDEVIVVYEVGVLRVNAFSGVVWELGTDVVQGFQLSERGYLKISTMGEDKHVIVNLATGVIT
jgi:hypothetical protein